MSRWIESCGDDYGRYYVETLDNPEECRHLCNEVCCNSDCDMRADFPVTGYCLPGRCPHFAPETPEDIERLKDGEKHEARTTDHAETV